MLIVFWNIFSWSLSRSFKFYYYGENSSDWKWFILFCYILLDVSIWLLFCILKEEGAPVVIFYLLAITDDLNNVSLLSFDLDLI